ncbi:NAD(P)/FAD-dependent oxidoreductase [Advenella mimigardefordensis]|uniref:Putative FAD-dependent oxidoreductase n=1 Tax=Advenella mimigardefordensis (strain DSM 17166 / LMG 22922 / DPN7) TaxID=1247726 RepID=W0PIR5_ADVMD|nr:FAD-binding oxidoreductase [Advenella mimigardefordensis]AHG65847.1 putative FAD-dependent oxidoreductase [Advenella mimigardefordensis DPN7]
MQTLNADVLIIGAGIIGASTAYFLSKQGLRVVLCDAGQSGTKASGVNFGGVRRQGRPISQMPLAARSHELWGQLRELIGIDGEYIRCGHLKIAFTEQDMERLQAYNRSVASCGLDLQWLDPDQVRSRYPWLGANIAGASLCPADGHANPRLVSPALSWAAQQAGTRLMEHCRITDSHYDGRHFQSETADHQRIQSRFLVNAAGAWAANIAAMFGEPVPLTEIYPQMGVTEPLPPIMNVVLGVQGGGIYARQVARGNIIFGGSRALSLTAGYARPSHESVSLLLTRLAGLIPGIAHANVIRFWSGVEGATPDLNPFLGPSRQTPGLFHGFGYSGAGFQIGLASGEVLAQLIATGNTRIPIADFRIDRFTADSGKL